MISVIIPAHNESAVIGRCLSALLAGARDGEIEIVVAVNGCTDDTEVIASSFGPPVRVVRVPVPSKTAALNAAEQSASGFPRFYVDADVQVGLDALRMIAGVLTGPVLAASPGLKMDTRGCSLLVRSYYRFWSRLPSVRDDLVGRGVYAVSAAGRKRFDEFPDVLNDDHFFRELFEPSERIVVHGCSSTVWAPRTMDALVARKLRVRIGNKGTNRSHSRFAGMATVIRQNPMRIVDAPAFVLVALLAGFRAYAARGDAPDWGRDDSSREQVQAGA
jgi:glycosyltransferase involved in cell wall biosynthesis